MLEGGRGYGGLLVVGDPHLEGRQPEFRKDDYPRVILDKLAWCLNYAVAQRLLPVILGDLFDKPRDNPTWMIGRLIELLRGVECIGVYGNHDCAEPELGEHDSLSLLAKAGCFQLIDAERPWTGCMNGRRVIIGGSSYRQAIPKRFERRADANEAPLVIWLAHHDVRVPGYEEQARFCPHEIAGVDLVVNGHVHRRLGDVRTGRTLWLTPGNISRRSRTDAVREHVPAVLRIDVGAAEYACRYIEVPHRDYAEVFHAALADPAADLSGSAFVRGLAELQARRTQSGAGLLAFLEQNLESFSQPVADEILRLAHEVTGDGECEAPAEE